MSTENKESVKPSELSETLDLNNIRSHLEDIVATSLIDLRSMYDSDILMLLLETSNMCAQLLLNSAEQSKKIDALEIELQTVRDSETVSDEQLELLQNKITEVKNRLKL
jgi:hypothetical protein